MKDGAAGDERSGQGERMLIFSVVNLTNLQPAITLTEITNAGVA